jgi:hypothetical protein
MLKFSIMNVISGLRLRNFSGLVFFFCSYGTCNNEHVYLPRSAQCVCEQPSEMFVC